jgi:TRAP-type mannitol/chloroaromatic compound transport system permease small subunit
LTAFPAAATPPGFLVVTSILAFFDRLSFAALWAAKALFAAMVVIMMIEIAARYAFGAPTIWAYDATYMINGSLFVLAAGYTLKVGGHIRIDFLSNKLPARVRAVIEVVFCLFFLWPALGLLLYSAAGASLEAYLTGQIEPASPWRPLIWPFYLTGALGLACLLLQSVAETVRTGAKLFAP